MKFVLLLVAGVLALPLAAAADDDDKEKSRGGSIDRLVTPTLWAESPIYFACNLTNLSRKTRKVTTRIINGNNGETMLTASTALAPRHTQDTTLEGLPAPGGPIYCDFTFKGSKRQFRGVAKLWGGPSAENSSDITAIAAE